MSRRYAATFLGVVLFAAASIAASPARTLTLAQARQLARQRDPTALARAQAIAAASAQENEARASRLPSVSISGHYVRLSDVGGTVIDLPPLAPGMPTSVALAPAILNTYSLVATVSAPVFTGFRLENRVKALNHVAKAAERDLDADRAGIDLKVDKAYWQLHNARSAERTVAESVRLVEAHLSDVRRMRRVGLTTDDDVLQVEVSLSEAKLRHIRAQHAAKIAQAALCDALSLPLDTEVALADSPRVIRRAVPPQESLERRALDNRPELRALGERRAALDRQVRIADGGRLPNVIVQANYEFSNPNQRYFPPESAWHDTWNVGVGVSWTVWDWGIVTDRAKKARADYRESDQRARQLRQGVALQVFQSRLAVIDATRRIAVAEDGVRRAQEHYRNAKARFAAGTASNTDVLDAEVALERAKLDRIRALVDQQIAWSQLEYAVGETNTGAKQ